MTDIEEPPTEADPPGSRPSLRYLDPRKRRRLVAAALLRALGGTVILVVAYYLLPFDRGFGPLTITVLVVALVAIGLGVAWEARTILKAEYPAMKGVEALALIVPAFLLLFASAYYLMDRALPDSFGQHLSRTDSLYFTVTTFSTVGYGDITAKSGGARIAVIFQMLADLAILGFGVRIILGAVQMRLQGRPAPVAGSRPESDRTTTRGENRRLLPATDGRGPRPQ